MTHTNTLFLLSGGWTQAIQLIVALSLLILLHEFGHYFFAKLFKTRVEKFYLFFDFLFPFPNILNFSLFKKKKGGTEYGVGWFPLGGYVKIAGMVDESMDKEQMNQEPQPWEFRSKKAWQRLLIMLGGIIVNLLVAAFIYIAIFGIWGEQYLPVQNMKYGIAADSLAESVGFVDGDKIVSVGGKKTDRFNDVMKEFIFSQAKTFEVERNGKLTTIQIPEGTISNIIKSRKKGGFIDVRSPFIVGKVAKGTAADKIGLKEGDSIVSMNGEPVMYFDQFNEVKKKYTGDEIVLNVIRDQRPLTMRGVLPETGILGFMPNADPEKYFELKTIKYGVVGSVAKGFSMMVETFVSYFEQFKFLFTSKEVKASESLGGIVSFGKLFPEVFSWQTFLHLTAFVSIILAFMNLLPIPGLDGGYVFFILIEMITRRKVSDKVMEYATTVGLVLLLGLMLYANGLDIFRLFKE